MYHWIYIYNIHTCIHIYLNKENKQSKTEHKYNNIILWFRSHRCSHNLVNWSQRHSPNLLNSIHIAPSKMCTQHVAPSMESKIAKKEEAWLPAQSSLRHHTLGQNIRKGKKKRIIRIHFGKHFTKFCIWVAQCIYLGIPSNQYKNISRRHWKAGVREKEKEEEKK